jgi:hypothetical protein
MVGSDLFLSGNAVAGTIGFCLQATTYDNLTFFNGTSSPIAMISQRTNYSLSYSGSNQGISFDNILIGEQAVIKDTIDNALSELTLKTYLCSSDSIGEIDNTTVQVDSMFVCISPNSQFTYVSLTELKASYGPDQSTTMTFIKDNFDIGLTTTEVIYEENKSILRIQIPVLAAFLVDGSTRLDVEGFADVGFEQQDRQIGKGGKEATIDFGMTVTIGNQVEEDSGLMGLLAGMCLCF